MSPDEPEPVETPEATPGAPTEPTPKRVKTRAAQKAATESPAKPATPAKPVQAESTGEEEEHPRAPRRPTLDPDTTRLLEVRRREVAHRPLFVREQAHRYARIGRWGSWRRPRGVQSKQRRHYGYRPVVVRVGYRSPADVRGRTPSGFIPVLIRNAKDLDHVNASTEAAILARTLGTRKRLMLEETARKRGLKILNPVVKDEGEE